MFEHPAAVGGTFVIASKAQRSQQAAEIQMAHQQAIGPSHEDDECPGRGLFDLVARWGGLQQVNSSKIVT
ncbi:MAG: hypothetical protein OES10_11560 [Gammaproteobacteria bacterium]|jgi:hypothetical protein|nr:hypothetical protein [Gammaproteobacteria bacterium]MDH3751032.1 hypothetical protein [Gammaproteobacteria bacterium]